MESGDLLKAVADTLVPGVSVEDDGQRVLLVERGEALSRADLPRDRLRNVRVFAGVRRQVDPLPRGTLGCKASGW